MTRTNELVDERVGQVDLFDSTYKNFQTAVLRAAREETYAEERQVMKAGKAETVTQARTGEVRAISEYNRSLVDFEAVQQVSLSGGNGVTTVR